MDSKPNVRFLDRTTPPHIITLILLAGIAALNMSIFLPSLDHMATYFNTTYATMQLSISAYLATTAVLQLFVGPISDKIGRRKVTLFSVVFFIVASLGAMMATSIEMFLFFRLLQAAVATLIVISRAIVRDMYATDEAAAMIGYVAMGMALVPMIGPTIGGAIEQFFGWQAIFGFIAAAGLGVLALVFFDQGETVRGGGSSFAEQVKSYPALLSSQRFWGYALATAFGSGAFFAFLGGSSFVASNVFGLSPLLSGIALGIPAIGYICGNFLTTRYSKRVGINRMALWGTYTALFGLTLSMILSLAGFHHPVLFFGLCIFLGLGNGMLMPSATAGMLSVRPDLAGTASGLGGAIMIGGGAALSQIAGLILTEESGELPLQILMAGTSVFAMLAMLFVTRRAAKIGA